MQLHPITKNGFSLVELSIVLVILGLLVGGVLSGQALIRAAQLRSVTAEFERYRTASLSFRDKYFAYAGDMANATSFWGSAGGTGSDATCSAVASTDQATCNGNGNGQVTAATVSEALRFWQHLANAGLIEGSFTGQSGSNPLSKLTKGNWVAGYQLTATGTSRYFAADYGNYLRFNSTTGNNGVADSYALKPEEAWNIDTKVDDGNPATGIVMPDKGNGAQTFCTSVAGIVPPGDIPATYLLTNSNRDCYLFFRNTL